MLNEDLLRICRSKLKLMQIVSAAMLIGALAFGGIILRIADWSQLNDAFKMMSTMAVATSVLLFGMAFVATQLFPNTPDGLRCPPEGPSEDLRRQAVTKICDQMTTENAVRYLLLEGGVFINVMVLMLEPRWASVGAGGFGILLMLVCWPLRFRFIPEINRRLGQWESGSAG